MIRPPLPGKTEAGAAGSVLEHRIEIAIGATVRQHNDVGAFLIWGSWFRWASSAWQLGVRPKVGTVKIDRRARRDAEKVRGLEIPRDILIVGCVTLGQMLPVEASMLKVDSLPVHTERRCASRTYGVNGPDLQFAVKLLSRSLKGTT